MLTSENMAGPDGGLVKPAQATDIRVLGNRSSLHRLSGSCMLKEVEQQH